MELKDFENKRLVFESIWKTIALTLLSGLFVVSSLMSKMYTEKPILFGAAFILFGYGLVSGLYKLLSQKYVFIRTGSKKAKTYHELDVNRNYEDNGIFEYLDDGFKVNVDGEIRSFSWEDVSTVFAYKTDQFTIDCINIDVFTALGTNFSLDEDTRGWYQFLIQSKKHLKQIPNDWELEIMVPAFEKNLTLLYDARCRSFHETVEDCYG